MFKIIFTTFKLLTFSAMTTLPLSAMMEASPSKTWKGTARDFRSQILYQEFHKSRFEGSQIRSAETRYTRPQTQETIGILSSEFLRSTQTPNYSFQDLDSGFEDGATVRGDTVILHRKAKGREREEKEISISSGLVLGQGFHYMISERLDELISGKVLHIDLAFPSQLKTVEFRIQCRRVDEGEDLAEIWLEIDNWFFRLFIPKIKAFYSISNRRLLRYEGPSNLSRFTNKKVYIDYEYQ